MARTKRKTSWPAEVGSDEFWRERFEQHQPRIERFKAEMAAGRFPAPIDLADLEARHLGPAAAEHDLDG